jgi:hypothetical protein
MSALKSADLICCKRETAKECALSPIGTMKN